MAPWKTRPQSDRLIHPLNGRQVEALDNMLQELFKTAKRLEGQIAALQGGGGGATALDDLTDVDAAAPSDGDVLTYDSGSSEWVPEAPAAAPSVALDDLTDVVIAAPADDHYLRYNGTNWVNEAVASTGMTAPQITSRLDWTNYGAVYANPVQGGLAIGASLTYQGSGDSAVVDNDGAWRRATTGAVIGNVARTGSASGYTRTQVNPTMIAVVRTGASVADVRLFVGFYFQNGFSATSDNPAGPLAMFRFSTSAGDTGWVGTVRATAGGGQTVSAVIGGAIAANTVYVLRMRVSANGTAIHYSVNGSAEVTINTNTPTITQDMTLLANVETRAASAKVLDMQSMAIYHPSAGNTLIGALTP